MRSRRKGRVMTMNWKRDSTNCYCVSSLQVVTSCQTCDWCPPKSHRIDLDYFGIDEEANRLVFPLVGCRVLVSLFASCWGLRYGCRGLVFDLVGIAAKVLDACRKSLGCSSLQMMEDHCCCSCHHCLYSPNIPFAHCCSTFAAEAPVSCSRHPVDRRSSLGEGYCVHRHPDTRPIHCCSRHGKSRVWRRCLDNSIGEVKRQRPALKATAAEQSSVLSWCFDVFRVEEQIPFTSNGNKKNDVSKPPKFFN